MEKGAQFDLMFFFVTSDVRLVLSGFVLFYLMLFLSLSVFFFSDVNLVLSDFFWFSPDVFLF